MQEPVRDLYRSFEILLILRHVEDGRIETTLFINPTASTPPDLVQVAKTKGGTILHTPDSATPITDQIKVAHQVVDHMIDG